MSEPTITPEQVMAAGIKRRQTAGRIADYCNHRAAGMRPHDAIHAVGLAIESSRHYEMWANHLRKQLELPPLTPHKNPFLRRDVGEFQ